MIMKIITSKSLNEDKPIDIVDESKITQDIYRGIGTV
jgi:hypothetical protein